MCVHNDRNEGSETKSVRYGFHSFQFCRYVRSLSFLAHVYDKQTHKLRSTQNGHNLPFKKLTDTCNNTVGPTCSSDDRRRQPADDAVWA